MTALTRVTRGENPANSDKLNQIIDAWNGNTAGINQGNSPVALTAINDPLNYAAAFRSADAAGKGILVYAPDGVTPLLRVDKTNGVYASPDGVAAAARVVTRGDADLVTTANINLGAWTTFAPTATQSASLTLSTAAGRYLQIGKLVIASVDIVINSAGTAANEVDVGNLPVSIRAPTSSAAVGHGRYYDATGADVRYAVEAFRASATSINLITNAGTGAFGINPAVTAAAGDWITLMLMYEAA